MAKVQVSKETAKKAKANATEDPVVEAKAKAKSETPAKAKPAKDKKAKAKSQKEQVSEIMLKAGKDGISAEAIATKMAWLDKDTDKEARQDALQKVRTLARGVLGSASTAKDGRNAVYVHPEA